MMGGDPWTIARLLDACEGWFRSKGIPAARLDAEILLAFSLGTDRIHLYTDYRKVIEPDERARYRELAKRRAAGEPSAYIVGRRAFWKNDLEVTPDVLIPRPETECVVEALLEMVPERDGPLRIVDVGTGSGNIAIALAKELPRATILAVDVSGPAVEVARRNVALCGVQDRVEVAQGDLYEPVRRSERTGGVDAIVSNPPYIRPSDRESLPRDVRDFEPDIALFDRVDGDGLGIIRRILSEGADLLSPRGVVVLECGAGQAGPVTSILEGC
ncbi:MAG: peptide chain release factor N(5)-glutamine methyltransferase, partial [Planctomycetes bacterium]|nr:peptide chain release factor N(5)-glutamine methyltransferase [Planctomycetota bacterium]